MFNISSTLERTKLDTIWHRKPCYVNRNSGKTGKLVQKMAGTFTVKQNRVSGISMGNNPMVGATVACAVAVYEGTK